MRTESELPKESGHEFMAIDYVYFSSDSTSMASDYLTSRNKLSARTCVRGWKGR